MHIIIIAWHNFYPAGKYTSNLAGLRKAPDR